MKKIVCVLVLLIVASCIFATRTVYGFYLSPFSIQASKNLADEEDKSSVYGFGAKAAFSRIHDTSPVVWSLGADAQISNYFYAGANHFDTISLAAFVNGGINLLDTSKWIVSLNAGFGANSHFVIGGDTVIAPAMKFDLGIVQHLYDNVSASVQFEGVLSFTEKSRSSFEFKTVAGVEYSF